MTADPVRALVDAPLAARVKKAARRDQGARRTALRKAAAVCVAPAAVFLLVLIAYPLAQVLWSAFHYVNLVNPTVSGFARLDNFATVLGDEHFWPSLWRTGEWTVVSVAGEYLLGLASAVALAQPIRARSVFRAIVIIPWVIPIVVAGLNWTWMLTPDYGVLNIWMVKLGLMAKPYYWLGNLDSALLTVSFVNIWRSFPFYTISLLAALLSVPREILEFGRHRRGRADPALRLHHPSAAQDRLADAHLHPHHLDGGQFRFHLDHDARRSLQRVGDAADHDLSLRDGGL